MTSDQLDMLLTRLQLKLGLGLDDPDDDVTAALEADLVEAEGELLLYLGVCRLKEVFYPKLVELAAVYYQRDTAEAGHPGMQDISVTEGNLSQKVTYRSGESWQAQEQAIFHSIARYRVVTV